MENPYVVFIASQEIGFVTDLPYETTHYSTVVKWVEKHLPHLRNYDYTSKSSVVRWGYKLIEGV